ncbi:hypothetical protein NM688_g9274 [Phlebia brevispora]|uniref:Uncharacterized protein n=1 Tax=Phlebia brevispora TaxID=194682 RepID=A0ACC1RHJ7_9APHY|nr:hypothetical protein NM688_g9274 [Phlebia brevispora]
MSAENTISGGVPYFTLNNGLKMPTVGLGCVSSLFRGLYAPLTSFDTQMLDGRHRKSEGGWRNVQGRPQGKFRSSFVAPGYGNEEEVGKAIRESGVPRNEIFLTTKLWNANHHRVRDAFEASLAALNCGYIDLYLMHFPQAEVDGRVLDATEYPTVIDTWKQMEKLLETGKVKSIGVSNLSIKHLETLLPHCKVIPVTNQVQLHPCLPDAALKEYCEAKGILLTAYSPFDDMQDCS